MERCALMTSLLYLVNNDVIPCTSYLLMYLLGKCRRNVVRLVVLRFPTVLEPQDFSKLNFSNGGKVLAKLWHYSLRFLSILTLF